MRYPVPASTHRTTEIISRSRFITTVERADSVEAAEAFVRRMREEFPDATHNCWAFVVGPPGSTGRVGMSDDGEPHGTAGRPMLNALLHGGVGDVAAVVTRYYGGTKLGTGGLVRAYGGSLQQALLTLPRAERVELTRARVTVDHASVSAVQRLLPALEAGVAGQDWGERVTLEVELPVGRLEELRRAIGDLTRGKGTVTANE